MSREIKFRVYVEFEMGGELHKEMEQPSSYYLLTQTGKLWVYGPMETPTPLPDYVKKAIPLFYTGLKDKNGVEIYEGDVIVHVDFPRDNGVVEWKDGLYIVGNILLSQYHYSTLKVIGNIYQNPELIKSSQGDG